MTDMIKNQKIKDILTQICIYLFFLQGFIYFLFPDEILNPAFPFKGIKYGVLLVLLLIYFPFSKRPTVFAAFLMVILPVIHYFADNRYITILLNYIFPISLVMLIPKLKLKINAIKRMVMIIWICIIVMAFAEFFFFKGLFEVYADMGYRVCSIMVNPNNLAIILCLISTWFLTENQKTYKYLYLLLSFIVIEFSGSRGGVLVFLLIVFIYFVRMALDAYKKKTDKREAVLSGTFFVLSIMIHLIYKMLVDWLGMRNTNNFDDLNGGRVKQVLDFLPLLKKNLVFPCRNGFAYVDDQYFHLWIYFGLPVLVAFLIFNAYLYMKAYNNNDFTCRMLLLCLLLCGITENFLYIWPSAFIYWGVVSKIIHLKGN